MTKGQGREVEFNIPFAPPKELSPNARVHWAVKAAKARQMRESGYAAVRFPVPGNHGDGLSPMKRGRITFTFFKAGSVDVDNLAASMKSWVDGLVDGRLFPDDSSKHVTYGEHQVVKCRRIDERILVLIEELT